MKKPGKECENDQRNVFAVNNHNLQKSCLATPNQSRQCEVFMIIFQIEQQLKFVVVFIHFFTASFNI